MEVSTGALSQHLRLLAGDGVVAEAGRAALSKPSSPLNSTPARLKIAMAAGWNSIHAVTGVRMPSCQARKRRTA